MKLKRATIHRYRDVAPGTVLTFSDGINVLLGRNGTGKTNLLKLISMMTSADFRPLEQEEFSIEYELEGQTNHGHLLQARILRSSRLVELNHSVPAMALGAAPNEHRPSCLVRLSMGDHAEEVADEDGNAPLKLGGGLVLSCYVAALSKLMSAVEPSTTWPVPQGAGRFDEALRYFELLTDAQIEPQGEVADFSVQVILDPRAPRIVPQSDRYGLAKSLSEAISSALERAPARDRLGIARHIRFRHEDLGEGSFLTSFVEIAGLRGAEVEPRLEQVQEERRDPHNPRGVHPASVTFDALSFSLKVSDSLSVRHDALSYGQKRLLAFLYYLECCGDVVIADELINGMHHEWIEKCVDRIEARQAFLTSQNPLLLDYLALEDAEQVRQSFVLCDVSAERWVWRNMDDEEAGDLYRAYKVGIQSIGDILRFKGLW